MYNFNRHDVSRNVMLIMNNYNEHVAKLINTPRGKTIDDFVLNDETKISWSEGLKQYLGRHIPIEFKEIQFRISLYRPFTKQYLYFDKYLNERRYQMPWFFPIENSERENRIICLTDRGSEKPFMAL